MKIRREILAKVNALDLHEVALLAAEKKAEDRGQIFQGTAERWERLKSAYDFHPNTFHIPPPIERGESVNGRTWTFVI